MNKLRDALIWAMIFCVAVTGYSSRQDILNSKIAAHLVPSKGYVENNNTVNFYKAQDGHFYVNATINNQSITFLADTGASDLAISAEDAKKIGIDINSLSFSRVYHTANGEIKVAQVNIPEMQIGPFVLTDVSAGISKSDMNMSLMGMSVLERFAVTFDDDVLTLQY